MISNGIRNFESRRIQSFKYRRLRFLRLCTRIRYLRIKFIGWDGNPFPAYTFHRRCITYGTFNSRNSHLSHSSFMPDNRYSRGDRAFFFLLPFFPTRVSLGFNFMTRWIVFPIIFNDIMYRCIEKIYAISNFAENIGFSSDWRTNDREIIKEK